jgi:BolA protein
MHERNKARIDIIQQKLTHEFKPSHLVILDESHKHIGHAGAQTGQGHFALEIMSESFQGKTTLQIHRLIYNALGELMQTDIHALRINARSS